MNLNPGESFQIGEVWMSPKGTLYKVVGKTTPTQVVLRKGSDGQGRKSVRRWDSVEGWALQSPTNGLPVTHIEPTHITVPVANPTREWLIARVGKLEAAIQDALTRDMPNKSRSVLNDALKR